MARGGADKPDSELTFFKKFKIFFAIHWRGIVIILAPLLCLVCMASEGEHKWVAYTLCLMALYWMTECIPLPVTAFLPMVIFPLSGVMTSVEVCRAYMNDAIMMFLGSMVLAYAIEQSNLHIRMALWAIRTVGYSHYKLLFAICFITMFVSMWITNTAATTMIVPIVFAVLRVFENQGLLNMYEKDAQGNSYASDMATCYFCSITFSATIGGIGTLVGTVTNIVFKGLFHKEFPKAPELLTFLKFSYFGVPLMLILEVIHYFYMIFLYFGFLRPKSKQAERSKLSEEAKESAKAAVDADWKKLGKFTFWEGMAAVLFVLAIFLFFSRSPKIFAGWGDLTEKRFTKEIKDSTVAMMIGFFMFMLPNSLKFFDNFRAKTKGGLPKDHIMSVLDFPRMDKAMPYSFMFLLGGGFALSTAANAKYTNLNGKIGEMLKSLQTMPTAAVVLILIILTVFLTNFASNVAICTIISPIAMELAKQMKVNPMYFNIAVGFAASFCFCLPVGTPGNLIVQSAASIKTSKMIVAGAGSTVACITVLFLLVYLLSPVIWPEFKEFDENIYT